MVKKLVFFVGVALVFAGCSFLLSSPFPSMASWADESVSLSKTIGGIASPPYDGVDIRIRCVGNAGEPDSVYVVLAAFLWSPDGHDSMRFVVMDNSLEVKAVFTESDFSESGERADNVFWDGSYLWWGTYRIDVKGQSVKNMSGPLGGARYTIYSGSDYYYLSNTYSGVSALSYSFSTSYPQADGTYNIDYTAPAPAPQFNWISAWESEGYFSILMDSSDNEFVVLSVPYDIAALSTPLFDYYPDAHFSKDAGYDLWGSGAVAVGGDSILVVVKGDNANYVERYDLDGNKKSVDEWPFDDDYPMTLSRDGSSLYVFDKKTGYLYRGAVWW